ncbi:ATP-binding protein [candidate division WOR-3 bacterium]|nr:ATP-binding protein [candidate division WOR-3 bacterium]
MKELVIISGKGGTGKTTLVASFASLSLNTITCDCDVDAANLFLILAPEVEKEEEFSGQKIAFIDENKCTECNICEEYCRFDAIDNSRIKEIKCEGCGVCEFVCPTGAISLKDVVTGRIITANTKYGPFFYGHLYPGAGTSGRMVTEIRKKASALSKKNDSDLILIDGSPGIGCPVIASITGADLALIVTEPTLSGEHDLERVIKLTRHFNVRTFVCINKFDINPEITERIERRCKNEDIIIAGKIPYDRVVTKAIIEAKPVVDFVDNEVTDEIKKIWDILLREGSLL